MFGYRLQPTGRFATGVGSISNPSECVFSNNFRHNPSQLSLYLSSRYPSVHVDMQRYWWPGYEMQLLGELQRQQNSTQFCDTLLQTEGKYELCN